MLCIDNKKMDNILETKKTKKVDYPQNITD